MNNKEKWYKVELRVTEETLVMQPLADEDFEPFSIIGWIPAEIGGYKMAKISGSELEIIRAEGSPLQSNEGKLSPGQKCCSFGISDTHFLGGIRHMGTEMPYVGTKLKLSGEVWEGVPPFDLTFVVENLSESKNIYDLIKQHLLNIGFSELDIKIEETNLRYGASGYGWDTFADPDKLPKIVEPEGFYHAYEWCGEEVGKGIKVFEIYLNTDKAAELGYYSTYSGQSKPVTQMSSISLGLTAVVVSAVVVGLYLLYNKK